MTENGQGMKYSHLEEGKGTEWTCVGLSKRNIAVTAAILVTLLVVGFIVYMIVSVGGEPSHWREPNVLGNYSTAAIATDAEPCAKIGV